MPRLGLCTPRKDPVPTVQGWAGAENLDPTGIRSPDHPAHTDCAIPAHNSSCWIFIISFADCSSDTASFDSVFNFIQYLYPNSHSSGVLYVKTGAASSQRTRVAAIWEAKSHPLDQCLWNLLCYFRLLLLITQKDFIICSYRKILPASSIKITAFSLVTLCSLIKVDCGKWIWKTVINTTIYTFTTSDVSLATTCFGPSWWPSSGCTR
jgi:hypothetical protein